MKRLALLVLSLSILCGCASLHMRQEDSTGVKLTKGLLRVPVGVMTLGFSEIWHSRERTMESWLGGNVSDLVMSWGPPTQIFSDGMGNNILVYTEHRTYVSPGYANTTTTGTGTGYISGNNIYVQGQSQSYTTYNPSQVYQWRVFRQFKINSNGRIIGYSWRGL